MTELEFFTKVMNELNIPSEFGPDEDDDCSYGYEDFCDQVHDINKDLMIPYNIDSGVSKIVLIPEEGDYVFKVPYNGRFFCEEEYDEENDKYYYSDEPSFTNNECASHVSKLDCWNYCQTEANIYAEVANERPEFCKFFLKTEFYGRTKDGHPCYIQEKADKIQNQCWGKDKLNPSHSSMDTASSHPSLRRSAFNSQWLAIAIDCYGVDEVINFVEYCKETLQLSDLHSGNLGYTAGGHPVIVDYAGWDN